MKAFVIKVPASSANLGPGFDSVGIALSKYLFVTVEKATRWYVVADSKHLAQFPRDEEHLIVQVALAIAKRYDVQLSPCKLTLVSDVPVARGLGSSSCALVAGIELANQLASLQLSVDDKLRLATEIEGHPDNVGPAIVGGLFIGAYAEKQLSYMRFDPPDMDFIAVIPPFELLTDESRNALPSHFPFETSIQGSALANVLVGALISSNLEVLESVFSRDMFHEPFRKSFVPHWDDLYYTFRQHGAIGVALSGAGPSLVVVAKSGAGKKIARDVQKKFPLYEISLVEMEKNGVQIVANV